jgi:hypothetical protein
LELNEKLTDKRAIGAGAGGKGPKVGRENFEMRKEKEKKLVLLRGMFGAIINKCQKNDRAGRE